MPRIDIAEVTARTELSKTTIYAYMAKREFPQPIKQGKKKVRWLSEEVDAWLQAHIDERDNKEQGGAHG